MRLSNVVRSRGSTQHISYLRGEWLPQNIQWSNPILHLSKDSLWKHEEGIKENIHSPSAPWISRAHISFVSSVRSSSGYHGLIEIQQQQGHFSKLFQILQIRKWKWKWKDPTCAIFFKSMGFKDIKYDIPVCQIHYIYITFTLHLHYIHTTFTLDLHYIYILTERPVVLSNAIFWYRFI